MTEHDVKPWYRQFWPWFLICLPASAVVASLYTVSLAVRTTDSLIVTSGDGMDVVAERHRAAEAFAAEHGLRARLTIDPDSGAIAATLSADTAVDWPKRIELLLSHPAFAERDRTITLTSSIPDEHGRPTWSGHFVDSPRGRWYLVLKHGDHWRLTAPWAGASTVHLAPPGAHGNGGG